MLCKLLWWGVGGGANFPVRISHILGVPCEGGYKMIVGSSFPCLSVGSPSRVVDLFVEGMAWVFYPVSKLAQDT